MIIQYENKKKSTNKEWWRPIGEALGGLSLKSLKVRCPVCQETGLAVTRWVKGPTLKPVYILHIKRNEVTKVCEPDGKQSATVRRKVAMLRGDIKRLLQSGKSFVLFSGGKDSLATLLYLKRIAEEVERDLTALYVDTTAGLPENTEYVRQICHHLLVKLEIVTPKVDYFTLVKKWGIPSFGYRWCCRELKIKPVKEYLDTVMEPKVVFDGIRAAESNVRKHYIPIWYHPSFRCLSVSPIFYWSDNRVNSLINSNGIPKTLLHSLPSSTECWCGAYKTETDFRKLYELNVDFFYKLVEVEEQNQSGYSFIYKNGCKKPLREIAREITTKS